MNFMNYYGRMISWLVFSMAISMAMTYFFGSIFPGYGVYIGLAVSVAIFMVLAKYIRKRTFRGVDPGGMFSGGINYICIACGHRFKGGPCPRCGSKMRRAEF